MRKSIIAIGLLLSSLAFAQEPKPETQKLGITDLQAGADAMLTDKDTADEYMDVWRMGRLDVQGAFHGTQYNMHNYASQDKCEDALVDTVDAVNQKAIKEGADPATAKSMAERFSSMYDCHELHLDPNVIENISPQPAGPKRQEPVQASAEPTEQVQALPPQPILPQAMGPAPMVYPDMSKLTMAPPMPVRPYYMAEMVSVPGYPSHWVNYASAYASPAQCWEAVKSFVADRQEEIQKTFVQMSQTYNASEWYRVQMQSLIERRKRLSCVVTSS